MGVGIFSFWRCLGLPIDGKRDSTWLEWICFVGKKAAEPLCPFLDGLEGPLQN